jgi:hypothetical protein
MTILNYNHTTQNPVLRSMPKCPNTYQALHAVALNPGGGLLVTAPEGARPRQRAALTNRQKDSTPYRAIHEKGPWWNPNHLSGSSRVPLPSHVERRAHAPPVAIARVARRLKVVVTESRQNKTATGGCVTRLVLRHVDPIQARRPQKRINRLRFMSARCRPWSEFGVNHD